MAHDWALMDNQLSFGQSPALGFDRVAFAAGLDVSRGRLFRSSAMRSDWAVVVGTGMSTMDCVIAVTGAVAGEVGSHVVEAVVWGRSLMRRVLMGFANRCLRDLILQWGFAGKADSVVVVEDLVAAEVAGRVGSCKKVQALLVVADHNHPAVGSEVLACRSVEDPVEAAAHHHSHMMALVEAVHTHRHAPDVAVASIALGVPRSLVVL